MTVEDLEKAVAKLPPDQFAKFREWFDSLDAARFDQKIEGDAAAGRLDRLAEQALAVNVDEGLLWFWIGSHADYDALIK